MRHGFKRTLSTLAGILILSLLQPAPVPAQSTASWTSLGLGGQLVQSLAADPINPTVLYVGTATGGIFKSTDAGASWTAINVGLRDVQALNVTGIAIDLTNPSVIYAGALGGGASGTPVGGVFKSVNGGATWVESDAGITTPYIHHLVIDSVNPNILYAAIYSHSGAVWKTTDGGTSWVYLGGTGLCGCDTYRLAFDPSNHDVLYAGGATVYKTTNAGASWTDPSSHGLGSIGAVRGLAVDPRNTSVVYAGTEINGVFKSTDGATSWSLLPGSPAGEVAGALVVDPTISGVVYAATQNGAGVSKSSDGGTTWSLLGTGLAGINVGVLLVPANSPSTVYAGTWGSGVFVYRQVPSDTTPPITTASASPAPNAAGWNTSNVTVTLTATDAGSGVARTEYNLDGAGWSAYSSPVPVSSEGVHTLQYRSTDNAGNQEPAKSLTLQLDKTAPTTTASTSPAPNAAGWNRTDVTVTFTATDPAPTSSATPGPLLTPSGIARIQVMDASTPLTCTLSTTNNGAAGSCSVTISGEGIHTLSYQAVDTAGNQEPAKTATVRIDKTPPTISLSSPTDGGTYSLNQAVAAAYSCADAGSGVASCSGPVALGSSIDTASVGTKTFTVNAADTAGNTASRSATYTVSYQICTLYDASRAVTSGSVLPIKLQLCDANNTNVSAASITLTATGVTQVSTNATSTVQSVGNANPDNGFRYDSTIGTTGGYIYNLSTGGLTTGTYNLTFHASTEPSSVVHTVQFQVR